MNTDNSSTDGTDSTDKENTVRYRNGVVPLCDLLEDSIKRIESAIKSHTGYTGLPTGFYELDLMLSGFQPSDMIVLAGRPSVGKTAFALNIALHVAIRGGKSVLVFSLEMAKEQLVQRLLCMEGHMDSKRLRTGFLSKDEFLKVIPTTERLSKAPIYINTTPRVDILRLCSIARRHAADCAIDLIVVDYLQLVRGPILDESQHQEICKVTRYLKEIALELRVPVLVLSQVSREVESENNVLPRLHHLLGSGSIESDADVVLMLSRPPARLCAGEEDDSTHDDLVYMNIAKQRNGPTGVMELYFDQNLQWFHDPVNKVD